MRIVLSGGSGFVGRELCSSLTNLGYEVILVGRDIKKLKDLHPNLTAITFSEIPTVCVGFDAILHLAAQNNRSAASRSEYINANITLTKELASIAFESNITRFVFFSSFHALDETDRRPYAMSKRLAGEFLSRMDRIQIQIYFLPLVLGKEFGPRYKLLNFIPKNILPYVRHVFCALKPTVSISKLVQTVHADLNIAAPADSLIFDDLASHQFYHFSKRLIDVFACVILVLFGWWLFAIIWVCVQLDSKGPGLFWQERVGIRDEKFLCCKFRTMHPNTEQAASHLIASQSITRVGKFLRRTKLDELPQIINIIRNEMSLVGPRPCMPSQVSVIEARRKYGATNLKPGITGLSQLRGIDMRDPEKLAISDFQYVARRSLMLDLVLIFRTLLGGGKEDKVGKI